MKYKVDIHNHTTMSSHAYSTLSENALYASKIGLEILGTADHGPAMPGSPHYWYFANFKVLPRKLHGVTMLYGCEANIIDYNGTLDLPIDIQPRLDFMIASLHDPIVPPNNSKERNTEALLKAMDNPNVCVIGHAGNPAFPIDAEAVVKKARDCNILMEINNSSLSFSRIGSDKNCYRIAELCKEYGTKIIINSDAHWYEHIGNFDEAQALLDKIPMPEELIINSSSEKLMNFLREKGKLL
jgi:putative hydrolase